MEAFVAIALLLMGGTWIAPLCVGLLATWWQRRRIGALERRVGDLEAALRALPSGTEPSRGTPALAPPAPEPSPEPPVSEVAPLAPEAPPGPSGPRPSGPSWTLPSPERVIVWVAAGLGGLAVVLTALLALVAVAERGWILPSLRVAAALVFGTGCWVAGTGLRGRAHPWLGSAVAGAGAGTLYGALWAGAGLYALLPQGVASAGMVAVTGVATLQAARRADRVLAWLGLIGGLLTPVLVSTGDNRPVPFFAYLTALASGLVAAAILRRWPDVILGTAAGAIGLHAGWAAQWYAPDQALVALGGAVALGLPFAVAAARRDPAVHLAGAVGAVGLALVALPWLGPIDPAFVDPRNGQVVLRRAPGAPWLTACAVAALPIPAWLAGRWRGHALGGVAGAIIATLATVAWGVAWWAADPVPPAAVAIAAVGPLLTGALATAGHWPSAQGLISLPTSAGALLLVGAASGRLDGPAFGVGVSAISILGFALARSARWGWVLPFTLLGAMLPMTVATASPEVLGLRWVLAPSLLLVAALAQVPLLLRWPRGARAPLATAALTGLAVLPPLHAVWAAGWGSAIVGALPLLLAAETLLAAAVLVRTHRVGRDDALFGLYVAIALFGLSAALPLQLQTRWLTVAWAIEVAGLAALARQVTHPLVRAFAVALAGIVGVRLLANPYALAWGTAGGWPVLNWTLYAWGVPMVCLLVAARVWPEDPPSLRRVPPLFAGIAILVGFALVNVQVAHAFQDAGPLELGGNGLFEGMVRSVSWATYGVGVLGVGGWRNERATRFAGFAFVLLAAVKVFAVDLWGLSGFARVGSVGGLAVTLLLAAFVFERLVRGHRAVEAR